MSRVYFHSPSGTAELRGSERAYAGTLTNRLALAVLDPDGYGMREKLLPLVPADSYMHRIRAEQWGPLFETWWSVGLHNDRLNLDGISLDPWTLTLNTMVTLGSNPIELLARIHGTCEIHGYVEGEHRAWLAEMIDDGLDARVLRPGQGWDDVVTLLTQRDDEPVVMSYSVCEQFPNYDHLMPAWPSGVPVSWDALTPDQQEERGTAEEELDRRWYEEMTDKQRWDSAMFALRAAHAGVDLHPDMWGVRLFGDPAWSVFDLLHRLHAQSDQPV